MERGCGCIGFTLAVIAGIIIGIVGLGGYGYYWLNTSVLSNAPVEFERREWGVAEEGAFAGKLMPAALAMKQRLKSNHKFRLSRDEADHVLKDFILIKVEGADGDLRFEDEQAWLRLSMPARHKYLVPTSRQKWLNLEVAFILTGRDRKFKLGITELRTGDYDWPKQARRMLAWWIRGGLETGKLFEKEPLELTGFEQDGREITVEIRVKDKKEAPVTGRIDF